MGNKPGRRVARLRSGCSSWKAGMRRPEFALPEHPLQLATMTHAVMIVLYGLLSQIDHSFFLSVGILSNDWSR